MLLHCCSVAVPWSWYRSGQWTSVHCPGWEVLKKADFFPSKQKYDVKEFGFATHVLSCNILWVYDILCFHAKSRKMLMSPFVCNWTNSFIIRKICYYGLYLLSTKNRTIQQGVLKLLEYSLKYFGVASFYLHVISASVWVLLFLLWCYLLPFVVMLEMTCVSLDWMINDTICQRDYIPYLSFIWIFRNYLNLITEEVKTPEK